MEPHTRWSGLATRPAEKCGLLLAAALYFSALPLLPERSPACLFPREARAYRGLSAAIRCGDALAGSASPLRGPARLLFGLRIDPNCADARTLEVLPGIGATRAAAVVAERREGNYSRLSDLRRVRGIGPRTAAKLEAFLVFPSPFFAERACGSRDSPSR